MRCNGEGEIDAGSDYEHLQRVGHDVFNDSHAVVMDNGLIKAEWK